MLHFGRDEGVEMATAYQWCNQYCEAAGEVSLGFPW